MIGICRMKRPQYKSRRPFAWIAAGIAGVVCVLLWAGRDEFAVTLIAFGGLSSFLALLLDVATRKAEFWEEQFKQLVTRRSKRDAEEWHLRI